MLGAAITGIVTHDSGLSWWVTLILIVIGGLIVVAAEESVRRLWLRYHQPRLEISCGNEPPFRQEREMPGERHVRYGRDAPITKIYETRLRVTETEGFGAPGVTVRVSQTDPPPGPGQKSAGARLRWTSEDHSHDFGPFEHADVFLCEWVEYKNPAWNFDHVHGHVPHVERGETVTITVQALAAGRVNTTRDFVVSWNDSKAKHPTVEPKPPKGGVS
jgi:hypothetical protein